MHKPRSKAELVELYMDALRTNLDAMPPAGLDAETAYIIRVVMSGRQMNPPADDIDIDDIKERVWNRTLFALYCNPDEDPALAPNALVAAPPAAPESAPRTGDQVLLPRALVMAVTMLVFGVLMGVLVTHLDTPAEPGTIPRYTYQTPREAVRVDMGGNLVLETHFLLDADLRPVYEVASSVVYHTHNAIVPLP